MSGARDEVDEACETVGRVSEMKAHRLWCGRCRADDRDRVLVMMGTAAGVVMCAAVNVMRAALCAVFATAALVNEVCVANNSTVVWGCKRTWEQEGTRRKVVNG